MVRALEVLSEIKNLVEQRELIQQDLVDGNHRGIDETILHLKRKVFFPRIGELVTEVIKECDIYQMFKYDRTPKPNPGHSEIPIRCDPDRTILYK